VIPEDYEASVEVFTRVLRCYLVPKDEIEKLVGEIRSDGYQMLRSITGSHYSSNSLQWSLPDMEISSLRVQDRSRIKGQTLSEIGFRRHHRVTVLAIRRGEEVISNPDPEMQLRASDILVTMGRPENIASVLQMFQEKS